MKTLKRLNLYKESSIADPVWIVQYSATFDNGFQTELPDKWIARVYSVVNWWAHRRAMKHLGKLVGPFFVNQGFKVVGNKRKK